MNRLTVISSDGHAAARMPDYRPYMEPGYRDAFDDFVKVYEKHGVNATDPKALLNRLDREMYDEWAEKAAAPGKLDGYWNPERRLELLDQEGIAGEIIFQDVVTPFVLSTPSNASQDAIAPPSDDQLAAGRRAYNRWIADFASTAPGRWRPLLAVSFEDVDAAIKEIRWASEHGFAGVTLPVVPDTARIYQAKYDPVYSALEEYGLPLNAHTAISNSTPTYTGAPSRASAAAMIGNDMMVRAHQLLPQFIFGGVLARHPGLKLVLTEMQSDWVVGSLTKMEHSFHHSALTRDIRDITPLSPREYWQRQCYLGSSLFSRAEIGARDTIGVDKMMLGMDVPHHEGSWWHGTEFYLRATLGAERVTEDEAKTMLSRTAAGVFGFDLDKLARVAERIGPATDQILTPPADLSGATTDSVHRGDLHRPLASAAH
ncbi:MAG: amidohydrolase family protein [Streptosporangiales bacterium]|nr:amidohydrolase family protein [Streptosporangiales bacterium]